MLGEAEERYTKKQKRVIATQETMQPTETNCEKTKVLDLEEKPFKAVIINVIKELKKPMHKEVKEYIMTMSHHTKTINRENLQKRRNVNSRDSINKVKILLEELKSSSELAEERMSKLEDRSMEIMESEKHREKTMKKNEQSLIEI